nr:ATP-binding protein [Sulfurimonas sp.]
RKIYSIDIGLNNATEFRFSDNIGKSLENAVFLELKRDCKELFYYRDSNSECDFIVNEKNKITQAIQVTYDVSSEDTKNREIKGLINACKNFSLKEGFVITYDTEDEIVQDNIRVKCIPFYKWAN